MKQGQAWVPGGKQPGTGQPRSIIGQLLIACSVAAVLIGGAATGGYRAAAGQDSVVKQLSARYQVMAAADNRLDADFLNSVFAVQNFALTADGRYLISLSAFQAGFGQNLATLRRLATPDLRGLIAAQARTGTLWFDLMPQIAGLPPASAAARNLISQSSRLAGGFAAATARLEQRLQADARNLTARSHRVFVTGLAWGGGALAGALLLLLAVSLSTVFTVTRPLRKVAATVGRLTAGDHAARAPLAGAAEVREVAQSVNAQAESIRLRAMAREAGLRIREHLAADEVLAAARLALARILGEDLVYLRLLDSGQFGPPVGGELGSRYPAELTAALQLPPASLADLRALLRAQSSQVVQDLAGPAGEKLPPHIRQALLQAGVAAHVLTPFGAGTDLLGVIVAHRTRRDRPWSLAEIDAVESVAADLGRGLSQARLYEAENLLVEDLRALDHARSDFFATVSHELRAPITTIEGYVEMLTDGEAGGLTPQQRKMLDTIDRSSIRLRGLIEDLLTLAKLESGAFDPVLQPVDLAGLLADSLAEIQPSATAAQLTLCFHGLTGKLVVNGDPGQLDQVMTNLLSNAVKYTPAGGQAEVTATADGQWAVVQVADTGIGIPEPDQKQLFTRFARASNATARRIPGTGLGLVIVKTIVVNHGGEVELESTEGAGTTVMVRLPLAAVSTTGPPNLTGADRAPSGRED
jgi:two-component system, OmpR family, phosphate regulon sensor histidine kinase PhoR